MNAETYQQIRRFIKPLPVSFFLFSIELLRKQVFAKIYRETSLPRRLRTFMIHLFFTHVLSCRRTNSRKRAPRFSFNLFFFLNNSLTNEFSEFLRIVPFFFLFLLLSVIIIIIKETARKNKIVKFVATVSRSSGWYATAFKRPHLKSLSTKKRYIPLSDLQHCPKHSHTKPNTFGFSSLQLYSPFHYFINKINLFKSIVNYHPFISSFCSFFFLSLSLPHFQLFCLILFFFSF